MADSALVIVAHPDDGEFLAGGAIALWARDGAPVTLAVITNGDKGTEDPNVTSEELAETRRREQERAAKVLGLEEVIFLGYEDGVLEPTIGLRRDLTRLIRRVRPHTVVTFDPTVRFLGENYPNHPDHRAAGDATVDAVFPSARDRLTFPELMDEGLTPHKARELWLGGTDRPNHRIDIEPVFETKIAALREHASQLADFDIEKELRRMAAQAAEGTSFRLAEAYRRLVLD
jgi:LmbE family N-acetylglucosaminyl deacetylase